MGDIFKVVFAQPILNLLVVFYKIYLFIHLPGAFGLAIITLTVLIRLILHPFFKKQIVTAKKMQEMKPHLDKLSQKHKGDAKKLQAEQMRLYQEAGINPASGCLFMIIQIPVFIALYNTLSLFLRTSKANVVEQINHLLYSPSLHISTIDPTFFGLSLTAIPQKAGGVYLIIPAITAVLQYFQAKSSMPGVTPPAPKEEKKIIKEETKKDTASDFQSAMNTQMRYIFPLLIGWFSYTLPAGLSLYWNIFSIFSIIQYQQIHKKKT